MSRHGRMEAYLHELLTSPLDGCKCLASRPGRFIHKETAPGTHLIEKWMDPQRRSEVSEEKKINFFPCWESNPDSQTIQLIASRYPGTSSYIPRGSNQKEQVERDM
jgi:hypothetical protein